MLIKRQQVARGQQKIDPAKHRSVGGKTGNEVEEDATKMDRQLFRHWSSLQRRAIKSHERGKRKSAKTKPDAAQMKTEKPGPNSKTKLGGGNVAPSGGNKMSQLVDDHGQGDADYQ